MTTLKDIERKAKELGAMVIYDIGGRDKGLEIYAPPGKIWACDEVHSLVAIYDPRLPCDKADCYRDLLDRMSYGLVSCDKEDCECWEGW